MKRLTKTSLKKKHSAAIAELSDYWNDIEIVVDGRYTAEYFDSPEDAIAFWRKCTEPYKRIAIRLNHQDENGDIQDIYRFFEYELGC